MIECFIMNPGHRILTIILFFLSTLTTANEVVANKPPPIKVDLDILVWEGYAPESQVNLYKEALLKQENIEATVRVRYAEEYDEFFDQIRAGKADIISIPSNMVRSKKFGFIEKNLILPLREGNLSHFKDILPPLRQSGYASQDGKTYGVPIAHGPYGLAYNTKKISTPPSSWNDLWKTEYKNQYVISSDQFEANIYITALASGISKKDMSHFSKVYSKNFEKKLSELAKNSRNQWVAVDTAEDLKGASLATSWGDSFNSLKKLGEDWKFAEPVEGTTGWLDYLLITKNAATSDKKRLAAEKWLNHVISPEFQVNHIVRELGNDPVNLAIKSRLTPDEISKHHLNDLAYFKEKRILWPVLESRDQNGFETLWKNAVGKK